MSTSSSRRRRRRRFFFFDNRRLSLVLRRRSRQENQLVVVVRGRFSVQVFPSLDSDANRRAPSKGSLLVVVTRGRLLVRVLPSLYSDDNRGGLLRRSKLSSSWTQASPPCEKSLLDGDKPCWKVRHNQLDKKQDTHTNGFITPHHIRVHLEHVGVQEVGHDSSWSDKPGECRVSRFSYSDLQGDGNDRR